MSLATMDIVTEGATEDGAPLDPNHSHFVLVESEQWGGEIETMYKQAEELAKEATVLTVLVNAGRGSCRCGHSAAGRGDGVSPFCIERALCLWQT